MTSSRARVGPARVGPDLGVTVAGVKMRNPVMIASGVFGYGREYADLIDLSTLGAIVVKGTSWSPREGNPPPRTVETAAGMLNSIGLQNPGVDYFLSVDLPWLRGFDVPVIVNVVGDTVEDYAKMAGRLEGVAGVAALEANISCPNVDKGGLAFGADPAAAGSVVAALRRATSLPLIVKLTPNVTDITAVAKEAVAAGADAISLINTLVGMAIDLETRQPVLARGTGGLSGPAIKPVALAAVYRVATAVTVPIIGMGGLWTGRDAAEFLMAGASAVAVGTAIFVDPSAPGRVVAELGEFMTEQGFGRVAEMVGRANTGFLGRYPPSSAAGGGPGDCGPGGRGPGGGGPGARGPGGRGPGGGGPGARSDREET